MKVQKLLGIDTNAKSVKGQKKGFMTAMLYLAPVMESRIVAGNGFKNVCPSATPGCSSACLFTAGHGGMTRKDGTNMVRDSRVAKTRFLFSDRSAFMAQLENEITNFLKLAEKKDLIPCVRLNGTSDLPFENAGFTGGLMQKFPDLQFYDYTKIVKKAIAFANNELPKNYHVTFSYAETEKNHLEAAQVAAAGGNVAAVFSNANFPEIFLGAPVVNGDETDLRFLDPKGVIVGLKAKGKAKKDTSGFVVQI